MKKKILVTNDDGLYSPGISLLYESVSDLGEPIVIAPETPKSSTGLGLTLHKPLRAMKLKAWKGTTVYALSGTPSDIIHFAVHTLHGTPDLVVSGVNEGDNTSLQVILSSGTVGAAIQASLLGVKSIAFSAAVSSPEDFLKKGYRKKVSQVIKTIASYVLEKGLPEGVDLLNVNFPGEVSKRTEIKLAKPARTRFSQYIERRFDPQGRPYYWIYGEPTKPEVGSDAYIVLVEKNIAVTPITLSLQSCFKVEDKLEELVMLSTEALKSV